MLDALGAGEDADLVYRSLLALGPGTVAEVAERVDRPAAQVDAVLGALASLDLATESAGTWEATRAAYALDALLSREQEALRERQRAVDRFAAESADLVRQLRRRDSDGGGVVEVIADREQSRRRCGEIVRGATSELLVLESQPDVGGSLIRPWDDEDVEFNERLLASGIRMREIHDQPTLAEPGRLPRMQRLVAAGMQLRVLPHVPTHLTICDRRFAVVPIDPDDRSTLGSMFIGPSGALTALIELFECLWARAVPLGAPAAPDPASEAEARLVALLTAGMKDESIARELGVSQPTVTRRITRLLGTLDAASRFQAGVQAARRGLV